MKTRPGEGWRGGEATKRPRRLLTARAAHGSELLRQMGLQFFSSRCKLGINNLLEGSAWCTFFCSVFFQRISKGAFGQIFSYFLDESVPWPPTPSSSSIFLIKAASFF